MPYEFMGIPESRTEMQREERKWFLGTAKK